MAVNQLTDIRRRDSYFVGNNAQQPGDGHLWIDSANTNRMLVFRGSTWVTPQFDGLTVTTNLTLGANAGIIINAGYASTNSTAGPRFEIPTVTGSPTGLVTTTSGAANVVFDTTRRAIDIRTGGTWFTMASMTII